MNKLTVTLTQEHMQIIVNCLNEAPHKIVRGVMDALIQQISPQQAPPPKDPE
jgi:hypothetical protein